MPAIEITGHALSSEASQRGSKHISRIPAGYLPRFPVIVMVALATVALGCRGQNSSNPVENSSPVENKNASPARPSEKGWDSDITSLPRWTPKESALGRLGEEVIFGRYAIRPPKGYRLSSFSDKFGADVKFGTYGWHAGEEVIPAMYVDSIFRPSLEWDEGPAARIAGDLDRARVFCGNKAQPGSVEFGNVNGLVTARARFEVTSKKGEKEKKYKGYQTIARDGTTSLDIFVIVPDPDVDNTLEILEASMLTLHKR